MGWGFLGEIGNAVKKGAGDVWNAEKKAVTDTGHFVGKVADNPLVQDATMAALVASGVGAPAAAAILAAEKGGGALLKPGGNLGKAAKQAAIGGVEGAGLSLGGHAIGKLLPKAAALLGRGAGGGSTDSALGGDTGDTQYGGGGDTGGGNWWDTIKGVGKDALGALTGGGGGKPGGPGGGMGWLDALLLGGNVADTAANTAKQRDIQDQAVKDAQGAWDANAPLRARAQAMLASEQPVSLANQFADQANPFAKNKGPTGATIAPPNVTAARPAYV